MCSVLHSPSPLIENIPNWVVLNPVFFRVFSCKCVGFWDCTCNHWPLLNKLHISYSHYVIWWKLFFVRLMLINAECLASLTCKWVIPGCGAVESSFQRLFLCGGPRASLASSAPVSGHGSTVHVSHTETSSGQAFASSLWANTATLQSALFVIISEKQTMYTVFVGFSFWQ